MSVITISKFGGLEPSVLPRALPPEASQRCVNMTPDTFDFRPIPSDVAVATQAVANPKTLYRFDRKADGSFNSDETTGWIGAAALLNLARQQLNDDTTGKIYYTHADGSQPMRWHNVAGTNRQVGVPAPTTAPTITSVNDSYVFTNEVKFRESQAVLEEATWFAKSNTTPSWVGFDTLPTGWVRRSTFVTSSDPVFSAYEREAVRLFAVNPSTNALISTYSDIPTNEATWVFNPALGGVYAELPSGSPLIPAWATGHTKWWCIPMRAYAQVFDINEAPLKTALMALKMPGTQGADPLLTDAQADLIIARLVEHGDKDGDRVRAQTQLLLARLLGVGAMFTLGAAPALSAAVSSFYSRTDVAAQIASAKRVYAEAMWLEVEKLGKATAAPWYVNDGG